MIDLSAEFFYPFVAWVRYRRKALSKHGVHSPFIFDLTVNVIEDRSHYPVYDEIEKERKALLNDQALIRLTSIGAGSRIPKTQRNIKEIAALSLQPPKYAKLLYRLVKKFKPAVIIELGTSLGISTRYLSAGNPDATVFTLEGDEAIYGKALSLLKSTGNTKIHPLFGDFDEQLPRLLDTLATVDLAYIDGNHTYEATMRYFHLLLPRLSENSILVFDDIYWSREMTRAWNEICRHEKVQYTVDLFKVGLLFFKPVRARQHFTLRF